MRSPESRETALTGVVALRIGHHSKPRKQPVQFVFDQHLELLVDRDARQLRVARLLQPFNQQRPVAISREDMCVEVVSFERAPRSSG